MIDGLVLVVNPREISRRLVVSGMWIMLLVKVYDYSSSRGDEEVTYKQSEAGQHPIRTWRYDHHNGGWDRMDDINSSIIGIIVTPKHASLSITQKNGIVQQLEVENAPVRWHLGKGCNPKSRKNLAVEVVHIGICVRACRTERSEDRALTVVFPYMVISEQKTPYLRHQPRSVYDN